MAVQEFDICSLAANTRAVLVGRGWAVPGFWCWGDPRGARGRRGRAPSPLHSTRLVRMFIDCSRPEPARIPASDLPTHWQPLQPIVVSKLVPSPAHALPVEVVGDEAGASADRDWPFQYAPAGAISRREAEHRVLRGLKTSRVPGIVRQFRLAAKSSWPAHEIVGDSSDYAAPIELRAFIANRRDRDDWWVALGWLTALNPANRRPPDWRPGQLNIEQKLVVLKSWGYTWRTLGERMGRSHEWARRRYKHSIEIVTAAANGPGASVITDVDAAVLARQQAWQEQGR